MLTTDFELKIQKEIDKDLTIKTNPNADDIAGVYYQNVYIGVAVPPKEIFEEFREKYQDRLGHPYRSISQAEAIIQGKLTKFKDPEVMKVMTAKL